MSLSPALPSVSTEIPRIWPVAVIVIVVVLRAPSDILPGTVSALAGIVALLLAEGPRLTTTADSEAVEQPRISGTAGELPRR